MEQLADSKSEFRIHDRMHCLPQLRIATNTDRASTRCWTHLIQIDRYMHGAKLIMLSYHKSEDWY